MNEKISIIIPACNSGDTIGACLAACRAGGAAPSEIVVVDDHSSDDTALKASSGGAAVIRPPRHSGAAAARNEGARASSGKILVFVDSDVVPAPGWLAGLLDPLRADPAVAAVQGVYHLSCPVKTPAARARNYFKCFQASKLEDGAELKALNSFCFAVRREAFFRVGGFDPASERTEDVELGRRLSACGGKILLGKKAAVRHLKKYSLAGLLKCDFLKVMSKTALLLDGRHGGARRVTSSLNGPGAMAAELSTLALAAAGAISLAVAAVASSPAAGWAALAALAAIILLNLPFYRFMSAHAGPFEAAGCLAVYFCEMSAACAALMVGLALNLGHKFRAPGASVSEKLRWLRKMFLRVAGALPEQVTFFVTDRCDLKCGHCFNWREQNSGRAEFTLEEMRKVLPSMGRFSFASLTGGEPFLREDLPEIARLLVETNGVRRISIPTNGFHPERVAALTGQVLAACRGRASLLVKVSLDAIGAEHDAIRGVSGSFDRAVATLSLLKSLACARGGLKAGVLLTASGLNSRSLAGTAAYVMKELDPDIIGLNFARGCTRDGAAAAADPAVYRAVYARILDWAAARGRRDRGFYYGFYRAYKDQVSAMVGAIAETGKYPLECRAGELSAVIDSGLEVYPCELLGEKMGGLRDNGLDFNALWLSQRAAAVRARISGCCCTHECNLQMNSFFSPARAAELLLAALRNRFGASAAPAPLAGAEGGGPP